MAHAHYTRITYTRITYALHTHHRRITYASHMHHIHQLQGMRHTLGSNPSRQFKHNISLRRSYHPSSFIIFSLKVHLTSETIFLRNSVSSNDIPPQGRAKYDRSANSTTPSKSITPSTPAKSTPARQSSLRVPAPVSRSSSFVKEGNKIPLRKSKSYTVDSDKSKLLEGGRMRPKSGDKPALSDRFSTFTPEKGVKRSESDSNIQKRKSGIPVAKSRTLSRSASGESSGKSPGGISTFGTRATSSKLGTLKNLRKDS